MRNPSSSSSSVAKTNCYSSKAGLKRGPWTPEEDSVLVEYINRNGEGMWRTLPKRAGLLRCGKSCRLRWMNYLRPSVKRGHIEADEEDLILRLHRLLGNRWSLIAGRIPGRTDNEIKNYWNSHLRKKLISQGIDPKTHRPINKSSPVPPRYVPDDKNTNPGGFGEINRCYVSVGVENNARLYGGGGGGGGISRGVSEMGSVNPIETTLGDEEVEDVFSSFLNSLMNDEVPFASQNQSLLPLSPSPLEYDHGHRSGRKTATKQINGLRESLDD